MHATGADVGCTRAGKVTVGSPMGIARRDVHSAVAVAAVERGIARLGRRFGETDAAQGVNDSEYVFEYGVAGCAGAEIFAPGLERHNKSLMAECERRGQRCDWRAHVAAGRVERVQHGDSSAAGAVESTIPRRYRRTSPPALF